MFRRAGDKPVRIMHAAGLMNVVKPRVRLELSERISSQSGSGWLEPGARCDKNGKECRTFLTAI